MNVKKIFYNSLTTITFLITLHKCCEDTINGSGSITGNGKTGFFHEVLQNNLTVSKYCKKLPGAK